MRRIIRRTLGWIAVLACLAPLAVQALTNVVPDPAFGNGGVAVAPSASAGGGRAALAEQADGKILLAGSRRLARFTPDGALDASFGAAGVVSLVGEAPIAILVHGNGGILVASQLGTVERFHPDGQPDTSFGDGGAITIQANVVEIPNLQSAHLLPDGSIVASGMFGYDGFTIPPAIFAVRLRPNGALDASFGDGGVARVGAGTGGATALLSDGGMVLAFGSDTRLVLLRLLPNGTVDPAFSPDPVVPGPPTQPKPLQVALQDDGRILVMGNDAFTSFESRMRLRRYRADGSLDQTFGVAGTAEVSPIREEFNGARMAVEPSGRIIVAGSVGHLLLPSVPAGALTRFLPNGALDTGFTEPSPFDPGVVTPPWDSRPFDALVRPDGRLLVAVASLQLQAWRLLLVDPSASDPPGDLDQDAVPNGMEFNAGLDPLAKDNDVFANARLFAMQQYRDFLGREGDAAGVTFWTGQLDSGAQSRVQMVETFFTSAEFQGTGAPVARLYFAYFLRIPDYDGLNFWIAQHRGGSSLDAISQQFAQSPEFVNRYGALSNSQFVSLVYQNVLGRAPDAPGLAFWTGQLDSGARTRGQVMTQFSESVEYRALIDNDVYVTMMYIGMLRRAPDPGGFDFWVGVMDGGQSGEGLIGQFLAAPEYRNRFLP